MNSHAPNEEGAADAAPRILPDTPRGDESVLVTALAVHVTVLDFFLGGFAHVGDLDVEVELLPGQGMIAIHGDVSPSTLVTVTISGPP